MNQIFTNAHVIEQDHTVFTHVQWLLECLVVVGLKLSEHHSEALEAIYSHVPGLKVIMPATPYDTKGLMLADYRR
nr:hypothetical protein [Mycoplasmopsis bovis]